MTFFFTFPDGRFVPGRTRWLVLIWGVSEIPGFFFADSPFISSTWLDPLRGALFVGLVGSGLFAQIYRYRHVSNPMQRQQTKWVVFGSVMALGGTLALVAVYMSFPALDRPGSLTREVIDSGFVALTLIVPLSIGVAMLRSHLWDIDIIIRRTLVYSILTSLAVLIYISSVVLLQTVVRLLLGRDSSQLATVVSTLLIAALFAPLRRRVQTVIEQRFYRRKYDAAKTLAVFSLHMRDEVELDRLTGQLLAVVEETMLPAHLSLWVMPARGRTTPVQNQPQLDSTL
jgi:hypothetical protein